MFVYPKGAGDDQRIIRLCGESDTYLNREAWNNRLNIVISSSPKDQINQLKMPRKVENRVDVCSGCNRAPLVYQKIPLKVRSCLYPVVVVIKADVDTVIRAPKGRLHVQQRVANIFRTETRKKRNGKQWYYTRRVETVSYLVHVMG